MFLTISRLMSGAVSGIRVATCHTKRDRTAVILNFMSQYHFAIASRTAPPARVWATAAASAESVTATADQPAAAAEASSTTLLERFIAGDDAAFVDLFNQHNHRLYTYSLRIVGDSEAAEDVTQEMWERILRFRIEPKKVANPIGLFVTIVRNLSLNHLRGRKRLMAIDDLTMQLADGAYREQSAREEMVLLAMEKLPFDYREVLILNTYSGYPLEEVAEMLGKSSEAIWKRASRARARLSTIVAKMLDAEEHSIRRLSKETKLGDGGHDDR